MLEISIDLRGKGVLVTGAGGSIGSACVLALARCGAALALNDIDSHALERIMERVRDLGVAAIPLPGRCQRLRPCATDGRPGHQRTR